MGRGEDGRQLFGSTFWHHEIKVVGEACVAQIRCWFGLCSPPMLEEAILVTGSAMAVDAVGSDDGCVQLPSPAFFDPPTGLHRVDKRLGPSKTKILSHTSHMQFTCVLFSRGRLIEFTIHSLSPSPSSRVIWNNPRVAFEFFYDTRRHFVSVNCDGHWGRLLSIEEVLIPGRVWCLDRSTWCPDWSRKLCDYRTREIVLAASLHTLGRRVMTARRGRAWWKRYADRSA
jgi:hypothetical protein